MLIVRVSAHKHTRAVWPLSSAVWPTLMCFQWFCRLIPAKVPIRLLPVSCHRLCPDDQTSMTIVAFNVPAFRHWEDFCKVFDIHLSLRSNSHQSLRCPHAISFSLAYLKVESAHYFSIRNCPHDRLFCQEPSILGYVFNPTDGCWINAWLCCSSWSIWIRVITCLNVTEVSFQLTGNLIKPLDVDF